MAFNKLIEDNLNRNIPLNARRNFNPNKICDIENIKKALSFSYEMVFGNGHHRNHRTGGEYSRNKMEVFCNTFQGKLSEIFLYDTLKNNNEKLECSDLDFGVYGKNIWDDTDLIVNNKSISIKSMTYFSQLLLLEVEDWTDNAEYIPNLRLENKQCYSYDYFVLIRVKPNIKTVFRNERKFYSKNMSYDEVSSIVLRQEWFADFAGAISKEELKFLIKNKYIIEKGMLLQGKTQMDATNYYALSYDMHSLQDFIGKLVLKY